MSEHSIQGISKLRHRLHSDRKPNVFAQTRGRFFSIEEGTQNATPKLSDLPLVVANGGARGRIAPDGLRTTRADSDLLA